MRTLITLLILLILLTTACTPTQEANQPGPVPTQTTSVESGETPPTQMTTLTPLEWIHSQPFQEASPEQAQLVESGFPEGYQPQEADYQSANLPTSELEVHITQITYEHPVAGQVYTKDSVLVQISTHQNLESRSEHLLLAIGPDDSWEYQQVAGHQIARFYTNSSDGRIWISGPYLITIWSSLDLSAGDPELDPMVDAFAALYLELYPPN